MTEIYLLYWDDSDGSGREDHSYADQIPEVYLDKALVVKRLEALKEALGTSIHTTVCVQTLTEDPSDLTIDAMRERQSAEYDATNESRDFLQKLTWWMD